MGSLVLLDGASMWFRSFFGVPSSITAPDGRPVNAVRGFIDAVATVITTQLATKTWHSAIGDPTIADAICDRVVHNAHVVALGGPSIRAQKSLTKDSSKNT